MASDIKIKGLVDQEKTDDITRKVLIWLNAYPAICFPVNTATVRGRSA